MFRTALNLLLRWCFCSLFLWLLAACGSQGLLHARCHGAGSCDGTQGLLVWVYWGCSAPLGCGLESKWGRS